MCENRRRVWRGNQLTAVLVQLLQHLPDDLTHTLERFQVVLCFVIVVLKLGQALSFCAQQANGAVAKGRVVSAAKQGGQTHRQ